MTSINNMIKCPEGTKLWILNLGYLEAEAGWFKRAGNVSTKSDPQPTHERRKLIVLGILISHPEEGLILFETGGGEDYPTLAGAPVNDVFTLVDWEEGQSLERSIELTGNKLSDVKMIVQGHLHLDHSGGLLPFKNTGVPVWVHEQELKNAFYSVATGFDLGVYMPYYLTFDINWKPFYGSEVEIAQGITMRHMPGHTPGQCIMQVNLPNSGTWIFTSDMYHVFENFDDGVPQGWLQRDHDAWCESHQKIKLLQRRTQARMIFGHCLDTASKYEWAPNSYD